MANKQILNREDSENESVLFDNEELVDYFTAYFLLHDGRAISKELRSAKEAHDVKRYEKAEATGAPAKQILKALEISDEAPFWKHFSDSQEEGRKIIMSAPQSRAEVFIENRYPSLFSSFLNYLEPLVLAGMRSGKLLFTWWRAVNYGFSVTPHVEDKEAKPNAFPYLTVEDMTEDDRRAFRWTVEDVFFEHLYKAVRFARATRKDLTKEEAQAIEEWTPLPYPADGYPIERLVKMHTYPDYAFEEKELYESWEYEMELYLPIAIHRLDRATYYATKYNGTEYKDYIKSLNVEEDFDYNRGAGEYKKVMQEGYVWHWEE